MEEKESFEEWKAGFEGLTFEQSAERLRDKILESPDLDRKSREYFSDSFSYVMETYKNKKPLDVNLLRIHMTQIKGYKELKLEEFTRTLLLLSMCGFSFDFINNEDKK